MATNKEQSNKPQLAITDGNVNPKNTDGVVQFDKKDNDLANQIDAEIVKEKQERLGKIFNDGFDKLQNNIIDVVNTDKPEELKTKLKVIYARFSEELIHDIIKSSDVKNVENIFKKFSKKCTDSFVDLLEEYASGDSRTKGYLEFRNDMAKKRGELRDEKAKLIQREFLKIWFQAESFFKSLSALKDHYQFVVKTIYNKGEEYAHSNGDSHNKDRVALKDDVIEEITANRQITGADTRDILLSALEN
jgi:ATP-dependent exoDNAse (exonuclease V) alpha subunit